MLRYLLKGEVGRIRVGAAAAPVRTDGLWKSTCFEAFVRARGQAAYHELNFSLSSAWAAYSFDDYRVGMQDASACVETTVAAERRDLMVLTARVDLAMALKPHLDARWELGLSAIIEEEDGRKLYWALAHPPGAPDFHHPLCFALELPPPGADRTSRA